MENLLERLKLNLLRLNELIVKRSYKVESLKYLPLSTYKQPEDYPDFSKEAENIPYGGYWGGKPDFHCWFYGKIYVPEEYKGKEFRISVKTAREGWDLKNPQFMAYINGKLVQGMDVNHTSFSFFTKEESFDFALYAYGSAYIADVIQLMVSLELWDNSIRELYYDMFVPYNYLCVSEGNVKEYWTIIDAINEAQNLLDFRKPYSDDFYKGVAAAREYLKNTVYSGGGAKDRSVICIGHTHIDIGWLWTTKQTREKVVRTFSTVVKMMNAYPEYKFMSSQAYLYDVVKHDEPELYEKIKELIKAGRWEAEGAMWVEADCNLASGESLVRQILYGKRFFKEEFGKECNVLWLPDVFGYNAALPQILKKSGVDNFVTCKISWNDTNTMPYDLFNWQGIDGSKVFTDFICSQKKIKGQQPARYTCYVGYGEPDDIAGTWERFQQKRITDEVLHPFGYGDGGGGPTEHQLMCLRRTEKGVGGLAKTKIEKAGDFLKREYEKLDGDEKLPLWSGELYLELHRGTLTTMARNKRYNRKSENLLKYIETLSSVCLINLGEKYPSVNLDELWKLLLVNQFHDILPGSAIKEVYDDSLTDYENLVEKGNAILSDKIAELTKNIGTDGGLFVYNPSPFIGRGIVDFSGAKYYVHGVPPCGYKVIKLKDLQPSQKIIQKDKYLENKFFRITFTDDYAIAGIYDKTANKEVVRQGGLCNRLRIYDEPRHDEYDAWEIRRYYKEKYYDVNEVESVKPFDYGCKAGFEITWRFNKSTIVQTISVYSDIAEIDFDTVAEWNEEHELLKAEFDFNVNADRATYDIQFGSIQRNVHENTDWDKAKFECCGHKFVDLSEGNFGVAVLNDCKYGHSAKNGTIGLSLLRASDYPNPAADKETHRFSYAIYPHSGNFYASETVKTAYLFNQPFITKEIAKTNGCLPEEYYVVKSDKDDICMDCIKKSEKGEFIVVRLYECLNSETLTELSFCNELLEAFECDLMENGEKKLPIENNKVRLRVKPFEIKTLKLKFGGKFRDEK